MFTIQVQHKFREKKTKYSEKAGMIYGQNFLFISHFQNSNIYRVLVKKNLQTYFSISLRVSVKQKKLVGCCIVM